MSPRSDVGHEGDVGSVAEIQIARSKSDAAHGMEIRSGIGCLRVGHHGYGAHESHLVVGIERTPAVNGALEVAAS